MVIESFAIEMSKTRIKPSLRNNVFRRDGFKCLWCGKSVADGIKIHVDHILPEAFGGDTTYENLGTLCEKCNTSKGSEYFGSYLLTTIFKLKDLESHFVEQKWEGVFRFEFTFYIKIKEHDIYSKQIIVHVGQMSKDFMDFGKDITFTIKESELRRDTKNALKEKIRNFLFENNGFIEELDGRLIFRPREFKGAN